MQAGRHVDAADAFATAARLAPEDAELHRLRAMALWRAGAEPGEVVRELARSFELDPARRRSARHQYEHARALARAGMRDEARKAFERVREIDPAYEAERVERYLEASSPSTP
jgi:tetratricopeptide (TPR) repeat protein